MSKKAMYTTSEYTSALTVQRDGNLYQCKGKDFTFFTNVAAAEYDAKWLVDYFKKEGKKIKRPKVYRVKFEEIK